MFNASSFNGFALSGLQSGQASGALKGFYGHLRASELPAECHNMRYSVASGGNAFVAGFPKDEPVQPQVRLLSRLFTEVHVAEGRVSGLGSLLVKVSSSWA